MEELEQSVPPTTSFSVGYFQSTCKHWIFTEEDLKAMYAACSKQIVLWCDDRDDDPIQSNPRPRKKRKIDDTTSKREEKEQHVEEIAKELKDKHEGNLELNDTQYRLWARMIVSGIHSSMDTPPQVPMITGCTLKRKRSDDFKDKHSNCSNGSSHRKISCPNSSNSANSYT